MHKIFYHYTKEYAYIKIYVGSCHLKRFAATLVLFLYIFIKEVKHFIVNIKSARPLHSFQQHEYISYVYTHRGIIVIKKICYNNHFQLCSAGGFPMEKLTELRYLIICCYLNFTL